MKTDKFQDLLDIMDRLRKECPWDRKQTFDSLRILTIEETYELSDAIIDSNYSEICKELGDILLHIVFYAQMGSELDGNDKFDIDDVIGKLNEKLIRRHPHIYANTNAESPDDVKQNWEKIKLSNEGRKSVLEGVPKSLPAMIKAYRIQDKAHGVGFDWNDKEQVWCKVLEELNELKTEVDNDNRENMEMEFGDVLFALINYSRFIGVNPDDALEKSNRKFISRFRKMEDMIKQKNLNISELSLQELDDFWNLVKKEE